MNSKMIPPKPSLLQKNFWLVFVSIFVFWSFSIGDGSFSDLFYAKNIDQIKTYISKFWPIHLQSSFLSLTFFATLETLAISIAGTVISIFIAIFTLYTSTSTKVLNTGGEWEKSYYKDNLFQSFSLFITRAILNFFRTIPEIIWAIIFVFATGLGPFAGVLAIGIHNAGVLGKLFSETIENVKLQPIEAIRASGSNKSTAFLYAAIPQAFPQLIAYCLYRWEVNIRTAAILGLVGAGGLGQQVHIAISLFLESRVATLTIAIFLLVNCVDFLSSWIRKKLDVNL